MYRSAAATRSGKLPRVEFREHRPREYDGTRMHEWLAAEFVPEARQRLRAFDSSSDVRASVGRPQKDDAPTLSAEPPQVVDEHCRASDKPLTIEKDVRMCARCVALDHKAAVPRRCVVCHARLKT